MASAFVINLLFHLKHVYIFRSSTLGGTHWTVKMKYEVMCWELQNRSHTVLGDWDKLCLKSTVVCQLHYAHFITYISDQSTHNATAAVYMIERRILTDPEILYRRVLDVTWRGGTTYIVHKPLCEAPGAQYCTVTFFLTTHFNSSVDYSKHIWLASTPVPNREILERWPDSYPVQAHTESRGRGVQGLLLTWVVAHWVPLKMRTRELVIAVPSVI